MSSAAPGSGADSGSTIEKVCVSIPQGATEKLFVHRPSKSRAGTANCASSGSIQLFGWLNDLRKRLTSNKPSPRQYMLICSQKRSGFVVWHVDSWFPGSQNVPPCGIETGT